jgi:hypothetical protein
VNGPSNTGSLCGRPAPSPLAEKPTSALGHRPDRHSGVSTIRIRPRYASISVGARRRRVIDASRPSEYLRRATRRRIMIPRQERGGLLKPHRPQSAREIEAAREAQCKDEWKRQANGHQKYGYSLRDRRHDF